MEQTSVMVLTLLLLTTSASLEGIRIRERKSELESAKTTMSEVGKCSSRDIKIDQGPGERDASGMIRYTVEIANMCASGCTISDIHVACGNFASATVMNPTVFRRVGDNDCLVHDGKSMPNGAAVSFQYANTFPYPLSVSSVTC